MDELLDQVEKEWNNNSYQNKLCPNCQLSCKESGIMAKIEQEFGCETPMQSVTDLEKQLWELREQMEDKDDEIMELCCSVQELRLQRDKLQQKIKEYDDGRYVAGAATDKVVNQEKQL